MALTVSEEIEWVREVVECAYLLEIISMFPPHQQRHVRLQLSNVLKGVISQRLIPRIEGTGRVAAVEAVTVLSPRVNSKYGKTVATIPK